MVPFPNVLYTRQVSQKSANRQPTDAAENISEYECGSAAAHPHHRRATVTNKLQAAKTAPSEPTDALHHFNLRNHIWLLEYMSTKSSKS